MVAERIEATDVARGIIQEVQNRPNGDVGITRGRQYRTGTTTEWTTGKISMLKMPRVANQFARWQIR